MVSICCCCFSKVYITVLSGGCDSRCTVSSLLRCRFCGLLLIVVMADVVDDGDDDAVVVDVDVDGADSWLDCCFNAYFQ